jgi:WD40 repeat protein
LDPNDLAEVKVCKFLVPYHCLVSSDLDGYLHFWAVTPSSRKGELLCSVRDDNTSEVGKKVNFPIRAIDFDCKRKLLFTGDEMGFMHKWDLSKLIEKLDRVREQEQKAV